MIDQCLCDLCWRTLCVGNPGSHFRMLVQDVQPDSKREFRPRSSLLFLMVFTPAHPHPLVGLLPHIHASDGSAAYLVSRQVPRKPAAQVRTVTREG